MKTFEFGAFRVAVREREDLGIWEILVEAPGLKPTTLMTGGEGPEELVASDILRQIRTIHRMGVQDFAKEMASQNPEMDPEDLRKTAAALFKIADAAGGDEALAAAQREVVKRAIPEQIRPMYERAEEMLSRTYEFGDVRISVNPTRHMAPGVAGFYVKMEGPGFVDEDLIQRPDGYLLARVAWEHISVIKRTLEWGLDRSVEHFMKVNYLGREQRPTARVYIANLDKVGRALGPARLSELEAALKAEEEKEAVERGAFTEELEERSRAEAIEDLERRAAAVEERIKAIRERRERRKRG